MRINKYIRLAFVNLLSVFLLTILISFLSTSTSAATKTISGSISISGGGSYTGGGTVTVTNVNSGGTASGYAISGRYSIGGLTAPGSQTYRVFLSPIPGYTILSNNIYTTFSSGTSYVNFIIKKNTPTPTKKPLPTPTKKPLPTPTKKPLPTPTKKPIPTATPVSNTKITLCVYKNGTTTPIQGAKITITGYSTVTVGSNGCYAYTFVRGKTITAKAEASGYVSQTKNISLTAATQQQNFSLISTTASSPTSTSSRSIEGFVYRIEDGLSKGISNIRVNIDNLDNNDSATVVTTNSGGIFSLSGLVGTRYKVTVDIPTGYSLVSPNGITVTLNSQGKGNASFQLASSTSSTTSRTISGTIRALDSSGNELSYPGGGTITVTKLATTGSEQTTKVVNITTNSGTGTGTYTATGLTTPGSQTYKISLSPPSGYTVSSGQNQTVGPFTSGARIANFTVRKSAPTSIPSGTRYIKGTVYTQSTTGAITGIGGVSVTIKNLDTTESGTVVITNSSGSFIRTGLVGNNYRVSIAAPSGYSLISNNNQQVSLGPTGIADVAFRLAPPGSSTSTSLNICVSKNGGPAISGAKIAIEGRTTETVGTNGCRSYTFLVGSLLKVTASATGYVTQTATIALNSATTKNFYLNPETSSNVNLSVKAQAATGLGAPISEATVRVCYPDPVILQTCQTGKTDNNGLKTFSVLANQPVEITVSKSGFYSTNQSTTMSSVNKSVTVTLRTTTDTLFTISGVVTSAVDNKPISGVRIQAGYETSGQLFLYNDDTTGSDGRYLITTPITTSPLTLRAIPAASSPYQGATSNPTITFDENSVRSVTRNFRLTPKTTTGGDLPTGSISVSIYEDKDKDGTRDANELLLNKLTTVFLYRVSGSTLTPTSTRDTKIGQAIFNGLTSGSYKVGLSAPAGYRTNSTISNTLNISNNNTSAAVSFGVYSQQAPSPSTASDVGVIYGRVRDQKGYPIANVNVVVWSNLIVKTQTKTNSNGYYITDTLPYASNYRVTFSLNCFSRNTYSPLNLNTNVVGLNRTLERVLSESCQEPSGEIPDDAPIPPDYPSPEDTYTAPDDPDSDVPSIDPDDPYPTEEDPNPSTEPTESTSPSSTNTPTTSTPSNTESTTSPTSPVGQYELSISDLYLQAIGRGGDNSNPNSIGNNDPVNLNKPLKFQILDLNNLENIIAQGDGELVFDSTNGVFNAILVFDNEIDEGNYYLQLKTPHFLKKRIVILLKKVSENKYSAQTSSRATLIVGDINNDDSINVLDYGVLFGCYGSKQDTESCSPENKKASDINDDGTINYIDYNIFIRQLQNLPSDI